MRVTSNTMLALFPGGTSVATGYRNRSRSRVLGLVPVRARGIRAVLYRVWTSTAEAIDASSAFQNASRGSASTLAVESWGILARLLVVLELHLGTASASASSSSLLVRGTSAFSRFADCRELLLRELLHALYCAVHSEPHRLRPVGAEECVAEESIRDGVVPHMSYVYDMCLLLDDVQRRFEGLPQRRSVDCLVERCKLRQARRTLDVFRVIPGLICRRVRLRVRS